MSDAEAAAERFYSRMSKPVAPRGDLLGGSQEAQERPSVSPPADAARTAPRDVDASEEAARRFFGHQGVQDRADTVAGGIASPEPEADQEASDGQEELSEGQQWHEGFRAREAELANSLYDLPMDGDGSRFDEPVMDTFTAEIPDDLAVNLKDGEGEQIGQAFVDAGLGLTTAASLMKRGLDAARHGPLSDQQIEQRNADGMKALRERWGDRTDEKLAEARAMISIAEKRWPNIKDFLDRSGLGSDPKLIQQLVARAERRPGRKR